MLDYEKLQIERLANLYDKAAEKVIAELGVMEQREWSSYGCGFASFYDSWFYYNDGKYRIPSNTNDRHSYRGVFVLFSLLEPMFAMGESTKEWDEESGASYLPSLEMLDVYESEQSRALSQRIRIILRGFGIPQASRCTLEFPIDTSIQIQSNMSNGPLKLFDAFYHWED